MRALKHLGIVVAGLVGIVVGMVTIPIWLPLLIGYLFGITFFEEVLDPKSPKTFGPRRVLPRPPGMKGR